MTMWRITTSATTINRAANCDVTLIDCQLSVSPPPPCFLFPPSAACRVPFGRQLHWLAISAVPTLDSSEASSIMRILFALLYHSPFFIHTYISSISNIKRQAKMLLWGTSRRAALCRVLVASGSSVLRLLAMRLLKGRQKCARNT